MVSKKKAATVGRGDAGSEGRTSATKRVRTGTSGDELPRKLPTSPKPATASRSVSAGMDGNLRDSLKTLNEALCSDTSNDSIRASSDTLIRQWKGEKGGIDLLAFEVSLRVRRIAMDLDKFLAQVCDSLGVKPNEMLLLYALRRVGPPYCLRPTDILNETAVTSGTVTYRIDQLVKQDLAERIQDPGDRRGYLIQLTDHGRDLADKAISASLEAADRALAPLRDLPPAIDIFCELLRFYESQFGREIR